MTGRPVNGFDIEDAIMDVLEKLDWQRFKAEQKPSELYGAIRNEGYYELADIYRESFDESDEEWE